MEKPFALGLPDASPFKMAPGQTFVELPDIGATIRTDA